MAKPWTPDVAKELVTTTKGPDVDEMGLGYDIASGAAV